jgi:hypothetical protein
MPYPPSTGPDRANNTIIDAEHINTLADAIDSIVTELGTTPSGPTSDLTTRLGQLDTSVAGKAALNHSHSASQITGGQLDPSLIPQLPTSKISGGQFDPTLLAQGAPDNTKFIRGDGVWAVPPGSSSAQIGVLGPAETPPPGSPAGSFWFILDAPTPPSTAPFHVGSTAAALSSSGTSLIVPMVQDIAASDYGVLAVTFAPSVATPTVPAGWALLTTISHSTNLSVALYTKVLTGAETNLTVASSGAQRYSGSLTVIKNVTEVLNSTTNTSNTLGTTRAAPSISAAEPFVVISGWSERSSTPSASVTVPTLLTGLQAAYGIGNGACSSAVANSMDIKEANSSFSPGNWVASVENSNLVTWSIALQLLGA